MRCLGVKKGRLLCYLEVDSQQPAIGLDVHSGLTPRGLPLSDDAANATAADSRHKSAATPFIFYVRLM